MPSSFFRPSDPVAAIDDIMSERRGRAQERDPEPDSDEDTQSESGTDSGSDSDSGSGSDSEDSEFWDELISDVEDHSSRLERLETAIGELVKRVMALESAVAK